MIWLDEIKKRMAAATPGPWMFNEDTRIHCGKENGHETLGEIVCEVPDDTYSRPAREYDAHFIANAPTDIDRLVKALEIAMGAMRIDIAGAGPLTGPIYHENIRTALAEIEGMGEK